MGWVEGGREREREEGREGGGRWERRTKGWMEGGREIRRRGEKSKGEK